MATLFSMKYEACSVDIVTVMPARRSTSANGRKAPTRPVPEGISVVWRTSLPQMRSGPGSAGLPQM
jgi:hypothetical protein